MKILVIFLVILTVSCQKEFEIQKNDRVHAHVLQPHYGVQITFAAYNCSVKRTSDSSWVLVSNGGYFYAGAFVDTFQSRFPIKTNESALSESLSDFEFCGVSLSTSLSVGMILERYGEYNYNDSFVISIKTNGLNVKNGLLRDSFTVWHLR